MKNIRHNIFETNSSSTHSISIAEDSDGILDTIIPDEDGNIVLNGGEFGWSWDAINDSLTKLNYCAIDQVGAINNKLDLLKQVVCDHTGAKDVIINFSTDYQYPKYSYIDHQSVGTSLSAFDSAESLKQFIFNPKSYLFTGNDNSEPPPNFFDAGKDVKYTHRFRLGGVNLEHKFDHYPTLDELKIAAYALTQRHPATSYRDLDNRYTYFDDNCYGKSSWDSFEEGVIALYKINYDSKPKIIDTKKIKFYIEEI